MAVRLRKFIPFKPDEILNNVWGEWVLIILLCGLFIAIALTFLPKRITNKRSGRILAVFIGLIMGFGLYKSIDIYNFNLESFGFLGIGFIVLILAFIGYGLTRMGMSKTLATSLTYLMLFLTFFLMTPSLFDSFAQSFPIMNLFFVIAAVYFFANMMFKMFMPQRSTVAAAANLAHTDINPQDQPLIEKEIDTEEQEQKQIRRKTIPLTKRELKEIDHIYDHLKEIEKVLKSSDVIHEDEKQKIALELSRIGRTKEDFLRGLNLLKQHAKHYRVRDQNRIQELRSRYHDTKDKLKKHRIKKEYTLEEKKIKIYEFINSNYDKITKFINDFDMQIQKAVIYIKENQPKGAIHPIQTARGHMNIVWHILKDFKNHEQYLLKLSKKEEKILKKEKKEK